MRETSPRPEVIAAAAAHLVEAHGQADFDPTRDLTHPGQARSPARVAYLPESPRTPSGFACEICGARVFPVAPSYGHPERVRQLLADHPELWERVVGLLDDERALVVGDWDRQRHEGGLARERLRAAQRRAGQATRAVRRPADARRIAACQEFLVAAWVRLGTQGLAVAALIDLARTEPERHERIVGRASAMSPDTLTRYLKDLPPEARAKAKRDRDAHAAARAAAPRRRLGGE